MVCSKSSAKVSGFYARHGKRMFDVVVAASALVVLSPIMAATAMLVRHKLGFPVIFRQERPGLNGQPFVIYKFRTMTDERDDKGQLLSDGERLTSFGKKLRRLSLDELPEFFNVLMGDMSLVGPRPLLMEYLERYSSNQMHRHDVKPGLTGWAQVNGRNAITWEEKFGLDLWYIENIFFILDIQIILKSILLMAKHHDISQPGHATMEEFLG